MNTNPELDGSTGQGTSYFFVSPSNSSGVISAYLNFTPAPGDNSRDQVVRGPDPLSTRGVHHVAASFGARTLRLYVDGELVAERSEISGSLAEIDDANVWIGRANFPEDELDGVVYEFRIYDQALSPTELRASFEAGPDPER
jgi:hypothetical protein